MEELHEGHWALCLTQLPASACTSGWGGRTRRGRQQREASGLQPGLCLTSIPCSELKPMPGPARPMPGPSTKQLPPPGSPLASHSMTSLSHLLLGQFLLGLRPLRCTVIKSTGCLQPRVALPSTTSSAVSNVNFLGTQFPYLYYKHTAGLLQRLHECLPFRAGWCIKQALNQYHYYKTGSFLPS